MGEVARGFKSAYNGNLFTYTSLVAQPPQKEQQTYNSRPKGFN